MAKLSAIFVKSAPPGKHEDGNGLRLVKRDGGQGNWVFRYMLHGQRREMGIGGLSSVSLKNARDITVDLRLLIARGIDPIQNRGQKRKESARGQNLLKDIARDAFESRKAELKGDGQAGRWFSPLELHVLPKIGNIPVNELTQLEIRRALEGIWHSKAATAKKAADRLNIVLLHGAALGLDVDVQAVQKAKALLGRQRHAVTSIPALPWQDVPAFYGTLTEPSISNLALRLLILTGVRSAPIRFLRVEEINGDVWTIPGVKMKARVGAESDFRVPLSAEALSVIALASPHERDGFLFPSVRKGVISDATMSRMMERRGYVARPHGFRTSLRTWLAERTDAPHEVAEAMLAHVSDSKIVRTYRQTDFLDRRRTLIESWARFCSAKDAEITNIGAGR